ncbi:hypothetical protein A4F89_04235 [Polynucleobacter asymbioticus]|nr:hypothetical protein A4F89_04235 [Polynucleobacter asymbioticus]
MARLPNLSKRKLQTPVKAAPQQNQIATWLQQGLALHQQGMYSEAQVIYEQILKLQPYHFDALQLSGALLVQTKKYTQAVNFLTKALQINPNHAEAYSNCGNALKELGRPDEALASYDKAISIKSNYAEAYYNRGNALQALKHFDRALASYDKAISIKSNYAEAYSNRGNALKELGRPDEALASYDKAISIKSNNAEAYSNRGNVLKELGRPDEALASYGKAISIKPDYADAHSNRGSALQELGRLDEALVSYDKAISIKPDYAEARWARATSVLPIIQNQAIHIQDCRADFHTKLLELDNWFTKKKLEGGYKAVGSTQPFFIAYQEENNKELLSQYGALCCKLMGYWQQKNNYLLKSRLFKKPIKLGIVSNHIREHSVWSAITRGWIEYLNRDDFQLFFFYTDATIDKETEFAKSIATGFIQCSKNLDRGVNAILDAQIDVLLYPEIGMDPMTVKLASLRLAPVQVASWGHPETTGLPTMDYYVSAELLEPDNPEQYYSERLVKLPNLGCYYKKSSVIAESIDLNGIGIAVDQPLLICPGTPFKYKPQYDHVFVDIAKQLKKCQLIFFTHQKYQLTELLKKRIASRFLEAGLNFKDYCVFIPWQPKTAFYSLMKRADVFLDTIGFSGFNTAMQAIECDLPIVTREGKFMRGRLASGVLKKIGLSELIAGDEKDYVNLAIKLVRNQQYNQSIRKHIKDNSHALYDDLEPVRALEKFIKVAHSESTKQT